MISFSPENIILITGASSGIGAATALLCNSLNATVIASGRNREALESLQASAVYPERFYIEPRELMEDIPTLPHWVKSLKEQYGKLQGLVCCAGYSKIAPLRLYDYNDAHAIYDMHVHVPLLLAKGFSDRRNNIGNGSSIVFIGSYVANIATRNQIIYAPAKAAITSATMHLAQELAGQKIRVNCVSPAFVETPLIENYVKTVLGKPDKSVYERYPFGVGMPKDIAEMIVFLLSSCSRWVTGKDHVMDGGLLHA